MNLTLLSDCCYGCQLVADNVEVIHWYIDLNSRNDTNPALSSPRKTTPYSTVDSKNFTFTSPSIYVAYTALKAIYECDLAYNYEFPAVTGSVYHTTIGYPPWALSTYVGPRWISLDYEGIDSHSAAMNAVRPAPTSWFRAINYTELQISQSIAEDTYSNLQDSPFVMWSIGGPKLKMPQALKSIDPAWNVCTVEWLGMVDPPRALTKVTAIAAPTSETSPFSTADPPSPGSAIASTLLPASSTLPPSVGTARPSASFQLLDPAQGPDPLSAATSSQKSTYPEHFATEEIIHSEDSRSDGKAPSSLKDSFSNLENTSRSGTARGIWPSIAGTDSIIDPVLTMPFLASPFQPSADSESLRFGTGVASNLENTIGLSTSYGSRVSDAGIVDPVLSTASTTEPYTAFPVSPSIPNHQTQVSTPHPVTRLSKDDPPLPQEIPSTAVGPSSGDIVNNDNGGTGSSTTIPQSDNSNALIPTANSQSTLPDQTPVPESKPPTTITSDAPNPEPTPIPSTPSPLPSPPVLIPAIAFAHSTVSANPASNYLISFQTLSPARTITVDGTPISYPTSATTSVNTESPGLGGLIMLGFGPGPPGSSDTGGSSSSGSSAAGGISSSGNSRGYVGGVFTGGAERCAGRGFGRVALGVVGIAVLMGL